MPSFLQRVLGRYFRNDVSKDRRRKQVTPTSNVTLGTGQENGNDYDDILYLTLVCFTSMSTNHLLRNGIRIKTKKFVYIIFYSKLNKICSHRHQGVMAVIKTRVVSALADSLRTNKGGDGAHVSTRL
ncbi:hypothetical protein B5X24_HaOG209625 [Helicoverpa armigera]|nr:hypothetical protein B5X24_HaOG209625 [Helicoverpa armigera]